MYVTGACARIVALQVLAREGETQDHLLRRFQRVLEKDVVLREIKAHRYLVSRREAASGRRKRAPGEGNSGSRAGLGWGSKQVCT